MAYTEDQKKAIEAESGTLLVSAAAGSGKTSVLTERIIRKLTGENAVSPDSLLVVTFTRAAAAEMRARVFAGLGKLISSAPSFEKRTELTKIQSRLSDMNVSTMDSFCMNIVKAYSHELGIEAEINIMDPGEAKILRDKTVAETVESLLSEHKEDYAALTSVFSKTGSDDGITAAILELSAFSQSEADPSGFIDSLPEMYKPGADISVMTGMINRFAIEKLRYAGELIKDCLALCPELDDTRHTEKMAEYMNGLELCVSEMLAVVAAGDHDKTVSAAAGFEEKLKFVRFPVLRNAGEIKDRIKCKRDEAIKSAASVCGLYTATLSEHEADMRALYPVASALSRAVKLFDSRLIGIKKKKRCYEFGDIMHFALKLLYDPASPDHKTRAAREYGASFSEILIDEYQDTNAAQDALFTALSRGGGENMFTVGDVKQSIYRFRLADPSIFMNKCDAFSPFDGEKVKSKIVLHENFRCRRGIVDAVNFVFGKLMSKNLGDVDYGDDHRLNFGAEYYTAAGEKEEPDVFFRLLDCPDTAENQAEFAAKDIINRIGKGETVLQRDGTVRKARPGDFCVLMRGISTAGATWKNVFRRYGLNLVAGKAGNLYDCAEIRLLNSLLKIISDPCDDVAATAVMLSRLFGFTPDDLAEIKTVTADSGRKHGFIYAGALLLAGKGNEKCRAFAEKLSVLRRLSEGEGPGALLRDIDAEFAFSASCLAMDDGEIRRNNVILFIETAAEAEGRGIKTAGAFAKYIDSLRENGVEMKGAAAGGGEDSVRLMTIHQSKGLEFPFVYVARTSAAFNKKELNSPFLIGHETGLCLKRRERDKLKLYETIPFTAARLSAERALLSEEMRIYYVAFTRARESLTVIAADKNADKLISDTCAYLPADGEIPVAYLSGCSSPARWFVAAFSRHPSGKELRTDGVFIDRNISKADIKVVRYGENCGDEDDGNALSSADTQISSADPALVAEITRRAGYVYPRAEIASRVSRYTASTADERRFSREKFTRKKPAFLEPGSLTGTEKGTATHLFMEYCDFERCKNDIEGEIDRLLSLGRLTSAQAHSLDREAITAFVNSPVYKLVAEADEVYRERRFCVAVPLSEQEPDVPERFADEPVMIIGQLDLLIIRNGTATIIDYKTDRVRDASELALRYRGQMETYVKAVALSMALPVDRCILYSLDKCDFAELTV